MRETKCLMIKKESLCENYFIQGFLRNILEMRVYLGTLVEHWAKIVRAKKPLVASFLGRKLGSRARILNTDNHRNPTKLLQIIEIYILKAKCILTMLFLKYAKIFKIPLHKPYTFVYDILKCKSLSLSVTFKESLSYNKFISSLPVMIEIFHYCFDDYTKGASPETGATCPAFRYNRISSAR